VTRLRSFAGFIHICVHERLLQTVAKALVKWIQDEQSLLIFTSNDE